MAQNILCLWCYNERKAQVTFSETSSNGICESCYEGLFANVFREFSWIQKLGFFFRRLFHIRTDMPEWHERDECVPIKRLTDLILRDALKRGATKIRYTFRDWTPFEETILDKDSNFERMEELDESRPGERRKMFTVSYFIDGIWHEMMRPPAKLHAPMMSHLKLMANISSQEQEPCKGKIFFRHSSPLLEELFLVDFQTHHDRNNETIIVELTWVPSKFEDTPAAA